MRPPQKRKKFCQEIERLTRDRPNSAQDAKALLTWPGKIPKNSDKLEIALKPQKTGCPRGSTKHKMWKNILLVPYVLRLLGRHGYKSRLPIGILYLPTGVGFGYRHPFVEGRSSFFWEYGMGYFSAVAPGTRTLARGIFSTPSYPEKAGAPCVLEPITIFRLT
ncbi:hypothetical protein HN51_039597 [Arachis hypogaea]